MTSDKLSGAKSSAEKCESIMRTNGLICSQNNVAVSVCNAFKQYGSKNPVLVNLNMTVAKGAIYGLLGASGCGKTTLLSCIVGRKKLDSGSIWVLGGEPGTKDSGVPGKRLGYMPQELALCGQFTIKETMMYFGWIFGMKTEEIVERLNFLLDLLHLPSQNRFVKELSCGQQRRVSFAVALMHDPDLLILDEPTVGVDPLLRQNIWNHLVHLSRVARKTVIITTHYIEEARQAHMIGLMRSGVFLAEESPQTLITMHRCHNLESAFLALSRKQVNSNEVLELNVSSSSLAGPDFKNHLDAPVDISQESDDGIGLYYRSNEVTGTDIGTDESLFDLTASVCAPMMDDKSEVNRTSYVSSPRKMRALLQKNFLQLTRNLPIMFFCFASPVLQVCVFCLAIGRDPSGLKLAIANMEVNGTECNFEPGCHFSNLSCRYLKQLNQNLVREYYSDAESAVKAVKTGQAWGAIYFNVNFSIAMVGRIGLDSSGGSIVEDVTLDQSEIQVRLDMSNHQIANLLSRDLRAAYNDFSDRLLKDCDRNPRLSGIPIRFNEPIYGSSNLTFTDFAAPGVVLTLIFFLAVGLTASTFMQERYEGLWDRSRVAGVSSNEILISHIITQFGVMCCQTTLVLIFILLIFDIKCNGSVLLFIVLTLLQGLNGMCFGFVISTICESEHDAFPLALGSFYPTLLLSGVMWPLEGMPIVLRYISYFLPLSQATTGLRYILARGWGLGEPEVYLGFISTLSWTMFFFVLTLVLLPRGKYI